MKSDDSQKLLTPADVAKRLGVSPITVRSWVNKGWLVSQVTPGGHRRFLWSDVERLMAERSVLRDAELSPRLLVVDDDTQFRAFLVETLTLLVPHMEIREAVDGFEAGMAVMEFNPDVVLLDYAMPGMNGAAVCQSIKSNPARRKTHVVAVTGLAEARVEQELMQAGADLILYKPVPMIEIENMLARLDLLASKEHA